MLSDSYLREVEINNKSGKMFLEKYISKHFVKDYEIIMNYCHLNDLNDIPFKEKVYHTLHDIPFNVLCKNPNCDNRVKFHNSTIGYKEYCSNRCVGTDPNIIKQKEEKSLLKFGTRTPAESDLIRQKIIDTNNIKYGGNSPMSSDVILNKSRKTLIKNWGVDNPSKHPSIINKRVESFKENIEEYKKSYEKTSLDRYGVNHPWMVKEIHNKTILKEKDNIINRGNDKLQKIGSSDIFLEIKQNGDYLIKCGECGENYTICNYNFYYRTNKTNKICTICNDIGTSYNSSLKEDVIDFIMNNYNGDVLTNIRNVISPYEIDIYLPDLKLAFEFNGLYWHSELYKDTNYHYLKSKMCEEIGNSTNSYLGR